MRHSVNIMFGDNCAQTIQELIQYVMKYGENDISPYFNTIHWAQNADGNISLSKVIWNAGDTEFITQTIPSADSEHEVTYYFDNLCAGTIQSGSEGDYKELHFCMYVPLYEAEYWIQAKTVISRIKSLTRQTHIDVVGFTSDLAGAMQTEVNDAARQKKEREKQTRITIGEITKYRKENNGNIYHFLVMQNMQTRGVSLNLNNESLVHVLGEFAMMCIENYQSVFGVITPQKELQAFGFSVLHLDKYYFIEYLLHKAYLFVMEREGIHEEEVDINMAFNKSKEILKDRLHLFSGFLKTEILPRLEENQEENKIVEEVDSLLKARLEELNSECDAIINDKQISFPAKRAILTALLGYDDELFVNTIYDDNTLIFDDLDTEAMNVFIQANNALLTTNKEGNDADEETDLSGKALLSPNGRPVIHPLTSMKKLRTEMQRRMGYIRELESKKKKTESQIGNISESKKCLIQGDFYVFGEHQFRLLPPIEEIPLQEDYTPRQVNAVSIDLRENFPPIKNQGSQGSCTAHALTSIYEYILKSNKVLKAGLSEAFVYYNARKKAGREDTDEGSRYDLAIESLVESGICEESFMLYNEKDFTTPPTQEAFNNGLLRRVKKAVNVKRTIDDLKSALYEGYPVAISANLYDSFGQGHGGFVSLPTQEEVEKTEEDENKHRRHAMVICGYNDDNKLFIVRNSWGADFGDNGYCYMPYSYITNERLVPFAAIITEVETTEENKITIKKTKSMLRFDETDITIRYAIINNLIGEEKLILEANKKDYNSLRTQYETLKQLLKNPNTQASLRNLTKERISNEIEKLEKRREKAKTEKYNKLDEFRNQTWKTGFKLIGVAFIIFAVIFLLAYFIGQGVFAWKYTWYSLLVAAIFPASLLLYFPYRRKKERELELKYNNYLEQLALQKAEKEKELHQAGLKMHIAGHLLSQLFELQSIIVAKYQATTSLLNNLQAWYYEEQETIKLLNPNTQLPFISLLKNKELDNYFDEHKENITEDILLCSKVIDFSEQIVNDTISPEHLEENKKSIRTTCEKELNVPIKDFKVYSYLCDPAVNYDFLDNTPEFKAESLAKMDEKSQLFLYDNGTQIIAPNKFILIHTSTGANTERWRRFYPVYFRDQLSLLSLSSSYKAMVVQLADLEVSQITM